MTKATLVGDVEVGWDSILNEELLKPVFQKDGSLSIIPQLYLHTCSGSIIQEGSLAKSKMISTKTLKRSCNGRMTRRSSRLVVLPLLTSEQGCVFGKEAWSWSAHAHVSLVPSLKSQSTKSRFITCQGLILVLDP